MLLPAFAALLLAAGVPVPREQRDDGVEFLDPRPIVVDLAAAPAGQQWRVAIVDGLAGTGHRFTLRVAFRPAGVIKVVKPVVTSAQGDVPSFVIALDTRAEGAGELVVAGGGIVVRRAISTTYRRAERTVPIGAVQFAGVRLAPFADRARIGRIELPGAPGGGSGEVGVLTSASGDTATVVRFGDEFVVRDAGGVGQYEGALDLLPDQPGTEATAVLRLRDAPAWPFLVLLLGLALVQVLDRYQARLRPRRLLDLRVARLRDRARALQRRTGGAVRIYGEPGLLLDQRVAEALGAADESRTEAEWAAWDSDGTEYQKLVGVVDAFGAVVDAHEGLRDEAAADGMIAPADREQARRALDRGPVGEALAGQALHTAGDLTDAAERLAGARAYLREFRRLYRTLDALRSAAGTRAGADRLLAKLFAAPAELAGLAEEVEELYRDWQPDGLPIPVPKDPVPSQFGEPSPIQVPPPAARSRRLVPVLAVAALILCVPIALLSFFTLRGDGIGDTGPVPTATPSPLPTGTTGPREIPDAPVAVPPPTGSDGLRPDAPATGSVVWYTAVLPLLLTGTAAVVAWRVARSWRRRRGTRRLDELDTAAIDRELRTEGLRFAVASGVLVVLSGMSVLYVGNPTFGTAGDYLTVALWGTALGEGVQLARRLWPVPRL